MTNERWYVVSEDSSDFGDADVNEIDGKFYTQCDEWFKPENIAAKKRMYKNTDYFPESEAPSFVLNWCKS